MAVEKAIKKEEVDVEKEEKWLLREIQFLEHFREDIQEIFELQERVSVLQKSAEAGKSKDIREKLAVIHELVGRDEHKFKKFRRVLSRGERRRIRYEKRVLGRIVTIEESLDKPKKKELEALIEQVHVYSARVLTELSWRVGKITELTSQKTPDISLIKKHLNAIIEASKALVALLERLSKFMKSVENKVSEKKLIQPIFQKVAGLTGYFREGVIKTAVAKSIVPLRYFLEKGIARKIEREKDWFSDKYRYNKYGKKFHEIIDNYATGLSKVLSQSDIEQLKNIDYEVPGGSTLLFLPGFVRPVLAYNIHSFPYFTSRGWVSHAIPGENLEKVGKSGLLTAPLEMVFEKKRYFTEKNSALSKRLTDGISFSFQEFMKYQAYMCNVSKGGARKTTGGMFFFSMKNVLADGLIFDFASTIDGWPEIVLRDEAYLVNRADLVADMLFPIGRAYPEWLDRYKDAKVFFKECKKNIKLIQEIENSLKMEEVMRTKTVGKEVLFAKDFEFLDMIEQSNRAYKTMGTEFMDKMEKTYKKNNEGQEYKDLYEQFNKKRREIGDEHFKGQALFRGEGYFYERLAEVYLNKDVLQDLIRFVVEDNFFQFSLLEGAHHVGITYGAEWLVPPLARFAREEAPLFFNGTIFQQGLDYLNFPAIRGNSFPGICLILTLMKEKPNLFASKGTYSAKDYVEAMSKMSPREVRKIFVKARAELIKAMEIIIKRVFRTHIPCVIDVRKGVLLVNKANRDEATIRRLVSHGAPVFAEFSFDINGSFTREEIDFFVKNVLQPTDLPAGIKYAGEQSYFYLKGDKLVAHFRRSGREAVVS
ncbi:hypothetical protein HYX13_02665 [Candidatus Woesearchaeota archaeon]|nr:hypothetical protein [Candidatus Woesearchaeota archaeon]